MSEIEQSDNSQAPMSQEEMMAALFANMVLQQTNMAMMFLGKVPHPETKEAVLDLEMAQVFIDNIEMLAVKTKGNLDKREETLLQQSLTAVRMAFVEAARDSANQSHAQPEPAPGLASAPANPAPAQPGASAQPAPESESHKKFSKKY